MGVALDAHAKRAWSVAADHLVVRYELDKEVRISVSGGFCTTLMNLHGRSSTILARTRQHTQAVQGLR